MSKSRTRCFAQGVIPQFKRTLKVDLCGKCQFLSWRDTAEDNIGPVVIVGSQPARGKVLDLVERFKQMVGEPVITYGPVIALDVSVLLGLTWLDEIDTDSALCSLSQRHRTDLFRTIIAADGVRFAAPFDDPVERTDHAFGWQREVDLDPETLAVEIIDDVEQSDAVPIGKLIVHEVHRLTLVNGHRHCQGQRLFAHQAMARLDPQVQFELAINSVDALVVPFKAFHVTQEQEAQTESPVALVVRQPYQPVGNDVVFRIQLGFVAVTGLADANRLAGQVDRG